MSQDGSPQRVVTVPIRHSATDRYAVFVDRAVASPPTFVDEYPQDDAVARGVGGDDVAPKGSSPRRWISGTELPCPVDPVVFHHQRALEASESRPSYRFPLSLDISPRRYPQNYTSSRSVAGPGAHPSSASNWAPVVCLPRSRYDELMATLTSSPSPGTVRDAFRDGQPYLPGPTARQPRHADISRDFKLQTPGFAPTVKVPSTASPVRSPASERLRRRYWAHNVGRSLRYADDEDELKGTTRWRLLHDDSDSEDEQYVVQKAVRSAWIPSSGQRSLDNEPDQQPSNVYPMSPSDAVGDYSGGTRPTSEEPGFPADESLPPEYPFLAGTAKFTMPSPPRPIAALQEDPRVRFNWRLEPGFEIVLWLLLQRGLDPKFHKDIIDYHMAPAFLRDIQHLMAGDYFVRYSRKGGSPHERFCKIGLLQTRQAEKAGGYGTEPEACLTWRVHRNSLSIQDRVSLATLVGVSFDCRSKAFQKFKLYNADDDKPYIHHIMPRKLKKMQQQYREQQRVRQVADAAAAMQSPEQERRFSSPRQAERKLSMSARPFDTASLQTSFLPDILCLEGPLLSSGRPRHLTTKSAFTLWFLDRRTNVPKSLDVCAYNTATAARWVNAMRGILAVNSISVGDREAESQMAMMRQVQQLLELEDEAAENDEMVEP